MIISLDNPDQKKGGGGGPFKTYFIRKTQQIKNRKEQPQSDKGHI